MATTPGWPSFYAGNGRRQASQVMPRGVYEDFHRARPNDPAHLEEVAWGLFSWAYIEGEIGTPAKATPAYEEARDILRKLVEAYPEVPRYRAGLAQTLNNLGAVLGALNQWEDAQR